MQSPLIYTVTPVHAVTSIKQIPLIYTVIHVHAFTSIQQSPVLKGQPFLVLPMNISYELNLF